MARLLWLYMVRLVAVHFGSYCLPSSNSSYFCGAFFPSLDLLNDLASLRILSNPISFLCSALVSAIELMQNAVFQVPVLAYPQLAVFRQSICWNTNEFALPGQHMPLQMPVSPSLSGLTPQGEETFWCLLFTVVASCVLDWKMANIRDREANPISADSQLGFCEQKSIFLPPRYHNFVPSPCNQLPQS